MQREKGKRFERTIAAELRKHWPAAVIRRASQAERADNPDVFIEGATATLSRLWLELQDARHPTPERKLEQAEDDANAWLSRRLHQPDVLERYPVVIWHRFGERTIYASTRLWVLAELAIAVVEPLNRRFELATLTLEDFIALLKVPGVPGV